MKTMKKVLAFSLALAMLIGMIPNVLPTKATAVAEEEGPYVFFEDSFEIGESFASIRTQGKATTSDVEAYWNIAAPTQGNDFFDIDHIDNTAGVIVSGGIGGAYDGESCIKLDAGEGNGRVYLNYNLTDAIAAGKITDMIDGGKYVASVWVKFDETSDLTFRLMVKGVGDIANPRMSLPSKDAKVGEWTQLFLPFTYDEDKACNIGMEMPGVNKGAVYVDKLQVLEADDATGIVLDQTAVEIEAGQSVQLNVKLNNPAATTKVTYTWTSDKENVAAVNAVTGKVAGLTAGTANITVTATVWEYYIDAEDTNIREWRETGTVWTETCAVTVTGVAVSGPNVVFEDSFEIGDTFTVEGATNQDVTKTDDDNWYGAAPMNNKIWYADLYKTTDGKVNTTSAKATGGVGGAFDGDSCIKLEACAGGQLYMVYNLSQVSVENKAKLENGKYYVVSVWVKYDENNNGRTTRFQIKNTTSVNGASVHPYVDSAKNLTEWTKLEVPFLYTDANTNLQVNMNMNIPAATGAVYFDLLQITELVEATADFEIEASQDAMEIGDKMALKPIMTPANASTTIVWTSSNPNVATVDKHSGVVTAVSGGTAVITATAVVKQYDFANRKYIEDKAIYTATYTVEIAAVAPIVVWKDSFEIGESFVSGGNSDAPTTADKQNYWDNAQPSNSKLFNQDWQKGSVVVSGGISDAYDGKSSIMIAAAANVEEGSDNRIYLEYYLKQHITAGNLQLEDDADYIISIWVKATAGSSYSVRFQMKNTGNAQIVNDEGKAGNMHPWVNNHKITDKWTKVMIPFHYDKDLTNDKGVVVGDDLQFVISMLTADNEGALYFDLLQIEKAEDATGIVLDKTAVEMQPKQSAQLNVSLNPVTATTKVVYSWSSSNESIATVDKNGVVTAVSSGTATITATARVYEYDFVGRKWVDSQNDWTATCEVTVSVPTAPITGPNVVFEDSFEVGENGTFSVAGATDKLIEKDESKPGWFGAAPKNNTYWSADLNKATGTAKLTGGVGGAYDGESCIKLEATNDVLYLGYYLKDMPADSKPNLVDGKMYVVSVWVKYDADTTYTSRFQIQGTTAAVEGGKTGPWTSGGKNLTEWTKLEVPFLYTDANASELKILMNMQGNATDTGAVYFDLLQITELVEATADFTIEGSEEPMKAGEQIALKPNMTPANASTTIVWESLNPEVATVDKNSGVVTAVSHGEATIKATAVVKQYDFVNRKYIEDKATYVGEIKITVACEHNYQVTGTTAATCTEAGATTYTCDICGDTYVDEIPALLHDLDKPAFENVVFNCLTGGSHDEVIYCVDCGIIWSEKHFVDYAIGEHTYTEENPDICDVCGEEREVEPEIEVGTIKAAAGTLLYEEMIQVRIKFTTTGAAAQKYGMLIFATAEDAASLDFSKAILNTELKASTDCFYGYSEGIAAKDMAVTAYYVGYALYGEDTYVFADAVPYSPRQYAVNQLKKSTTKTETKDLCSALMHYGAAAQQKFSDTPLAAEELMNYGIEGIYDIPYDANVLGEEKFSVDTTVTNGLQINAATMLFEGAITYRVKFTPSGEALNKDLYMEYVIKGETKVVPIELKNGTYYAYAADNAPKDMDEVITCRPFYYGDNGEKVYGAELVYSGYEYVRRIVRNSSSAKDIALSKAFAMYIYYVDIALAK